MEIRHLRYFVAVAEELNFTRAAAKLHLAQPSLTRQIKDLEDELAVLLFDRSKNRISLTEGGRIFLGEARRLIAECAVCVRAVQQVARVESGQLNIGYIAHVFSDILPTALREFRKACPQAELHLFEMNAAEQYRALEENEIDLGLVDVRPHPMGIELYCTCVGQHPILAAISDRDPLAKNDKISLRSLEQMFFVERSERSYPGARARLVETCRGAGFIPRILHEAEGYSSIISFVAEDLAVALLPEQKRTPPHHDGVVFRPLQPQVTCQTYAIWRSDNRSPYLSRYQDIMKQLSPSKRWRVVALGGPRAEFLLKSMPRDNKPPSVTVKSL